MLLLALTTGCGLQRTVFLYPPKEGTIETNLTDGITTFEHNWEENPSEFRGYEIYYKLYGTEQDEKINQEEDSILDPDTQARPRLEALDFVRLRSQDEPRARPLIAIPFDKRGDSVTITLNFSGVREGNSAFFEWEAEDGDSERGDLVRTPEPGDYEEFSNDSGNYSSDQDDVDNNAGSAGSGPQLVAYVLAYGEDFQELTSVYSFEARSLYQPAFDDLLGP